jgi:two-component system, cell cycle sensor histidine kinase PleC
MFEVTAEMIARGRGADPRTVAERRRVALHVREAREKLTSSGTGHRAFDLELLRIYAERRRGALPGLALLAVALAFVALHWTSQMAVLVWAGIVCAALLLVSRLAGSFLAQMDSATPPKRWARLFALGEVVLGSAYALIVLFSWIGEAPQETTFILMALLLVAAMNATVTATVPSAVYGGLVPMTLAILAVLHPAGLAGNDWLIAVLALGTLVYFVDLSRKLHASALQALTFEVEKDELIAELEQSKANSDLARRRAEESNLAKSRFLATMSHELRTPLNAILGFSEVMKSELFGRHAVPAYKDYAGDIHSSGEHLLMLINEILDLSRVEAGRYELREEAVDLAAILDECRHLMALRAKKKGIEIIEEPAGLLPRLWADGRALRQVGLNLLSNAIKFTPQGGQVRIRLGLDEIGRQYFAIVDTGAGIPENEIPLVMASFGRGTFAHKAAEEGTGLGLPIVKGLVELHGGTFALRSKVREGTEVTVTFPLERAMDVLPPLDLEVRDAA